MRFAEVEVDSDYVLERRGGRLRVTALPTDPRDVRRGQLRVRFVGGIVDGRVDLQPLSKITRRWGEKPKNASSTAVAMLMERPGPWPPSVGDGVYWSSRTGALQWTVVELDPTQPVARIGAELFTRWQEQVALVRDLTAVPIRTPLPLPHGRRRTVTARYAQSSSARYARPTIDPEDPIGSLLDFVTFSKEARCAYRARFARRQDLDHVEHLIRLELITKGRILGRHSHQIIIRARGFEIRIPNNQLGRDEIVIDELHFPKRSAGRRGPRSSRRKRQG